MKEMSNEIYLLAALIIAGLTIVVFLINKKLTGIAEKTRPDETLIEWLKSSQETMQASTKTLNERLDRAVQVIAGVQRSIGEMAEIGRGMRDLQEFLRSPKLRGAIGEQVLRELLGQTLPKQAFHLQYTFKSGVIVDAAIKTEAGLVPIDSKFPMDNFRKMMAAKTEREKKTHRRQLVIDVKKHIKDISSKYILTEEGTLDYALMYIPSEAVYYEIMANIPELADYAHEMRVLPVSPSTFYAYLRAILMSFEGRKIEQRARQILSVIRAVQKDYTKLEGNLSVLGKHIQNAYNQMHNVLSGFTLLGQKLSSTQALGEKKRETEIKQLEIKEK